MKILPKLLQATILGLSLQLVFPAGGAATAPPPAEAFFNTPLFGGAVISPDGKHLAARIAQPGGRTQLVVIDLASRKAQVVANFKDADVSSVLWVNDKRLVFQSYDSKSESINAAFSSSVFAVDRDGGRLLQLAADATSRQMRGAISPHLLRTHRIRLADMGGRKDSDWIYIEEPRKDGPHENGFIDLRRVNTVDGRNEEVKGPANTQRWLLDKQGQPRVAMARAAGNTTVHLLGENGSWREVASFSQHAGSSEGMLPLGFGEGNTLYVQSSRHGDKSAVYRYDMATGKLDGEPLLALDGYDFSGSLVIRDGKLLGVQYLRDGEGVQWFDPALAAMQADIDGQLPNMVNAVQLPQDSNAPHVLVRSYSDVQPPRYYAYDRSARKLSIVGETRPDIKPSQMGMQEEVRYAARDGLEIPAMLTLPAQSARKNLPMVVLVHGGPWSRGSQWGWRPDVQFLASRGYAVLQPEFRGSTGFGAKHYKSGWKQWGLKMQDDIADGAKWAIAQGVADPKRICIAGASYGGYATLMGLINDHELYQCGIDWVGVTDIKLLFNQSWSYPDDVSEDSKRYTLPETIGDPEKDAAQIKATSPVEQAHRIKRPLLLAYGGKDRRVPINHGTRFRDTVTLTNKDVEWVEYEEEGHGWRQPKNNIDFWTRVERFLNRNIGNKQ